MIFATNNKKKLEQIKALCEGIVDVYGLEEMGIKIDVEEGGKTFEENAVKKANEVYKIAKGMQNGVEVLSDDSGICIDFFDGWPGVYTHRFLPNSTPEERNDYIIEKMQNVDEDLRGVKNVCVLAFVDKGGLTHIFEGAIYGKIAHKQRGDNLFGFDPIFELTNKKTLAELSEQEKLEVNARSLAFKKFLEFYKNKKLQERL